MNAPRSGGRSPYLIEDIAVMLRRSRLGMPWRWRTELLLVLLLLAAWGRLSWTMRTYLWSAVVLGCGLLVLVLVPATRRYLLWRCWCLFTRHRLHRAFWEMRIHTRAGRLPQVTWIRPTLTGERAWIVLRAGMTFSDFENAADAIAVACGAFTVRMTVSARWSWLVTADILRRDLLAPGTIIPSLLDLARASWPELPAARQE